MLVGLFRHSLGWHKRGPGQLKSQSQIFFQTLQSQISTDFFPCRLEICTVLNSTDSDTGDEPYVREHAGHGTARRRRRVWHCWGKIGKTPR